MKALFLGLGGVGQRHLRNLKALRPDTEIAAVRHARRTFEITADLAVDDQVNIEEKYDIRVFKSLEQGIDQFAPDISIIATPSSLHAEQASSLVAAGVPILLEKPLAHDEPAMDALVNAQKIHATPVMVGYMLRFHPGARKLRDMIRDGAVGRLYSGHVVAHTYMPDWHSYESPSDYYVGSRALGGGTVLTNIHLIDLLAWILGTPERLWCRGGRLSNLDIDVEDTVSALFDYQIDGSPVPVTMNMSFVQNPQANQMVFRGASGEIVWDLGADELVLTDTSGKSEQISVEGLEWNDLFIREMQHFIEAVTGNHPMESALQDVTGGQRMAFALKSSLERNEIVCL